MLLPSLLALLPPLAPASQSQESAGVRPTFAESSACALCHQNAPRASAMRDADGRPLAPFDLWRSSMMANAARDPLWRALLSAETATWPGRAAEIEAKCLSCHAPMAHRTALAAHGTGTLTHALDCRAEQGVLARDGVSCALCHQIRPDGLGSARSFGGHFEIGTDRAMYGPHDGLFAHPMQMHTGFTPMLGAHVRRSALCGSCHTLFTSALDEAGRATGDSLPEQTPYLEWRNSAYTDEVPAPGPHAATCQDCHLPTVDADGRPIRTRIARNPGGRDWPPTRAREPFGRHVFVGGNTLVPALLRDHAEQLGATASAAAFDATLAAARTQLGERTARIAIEDVERAGDRLVFAVRVENLAGHKLPTGHPTRRVWLALRVLDAQDRALFESGSWDAQGRILGADGRPLPSELAGGPIEPHRDRIRVPGDVQIWEAVMADAAGAPTFRLLSGARWLADDRLLPLGWSPEHPDAPATRPTGTGRDRDFAGGRDTVHVDVALPAPRGPLRIEAELLYQPLGARWAAELLRVETPEVRRFGQLWSEADRRPTVLARAGVTI